MSESDGLRMRRLQVTNSTLKLLFSVTEGLPMASSRLKVRWVLSRPVFPPILFLLALTLASCNSQSRQSERPFARYTAERVLTMVQDPNEVESLLQYPVELAKAPDGRHFVVDSTSHRIVVYSSQGRYLYAFGQEGSGPADIRSVRIVRVDDHELVLFDRGNRALKTFSLSGHLESMWRLPDSVPIIARTVIPLRSAGFAVTWRDWRDEGIVRRFQAGATVFDSSGQELCEVRSPFIPWLTIARGADGSSSAVEIPFRGDVAILVDDRTERMFVSNGHEGRLTVRDLHCQVVDTLRIAIPREKVTTAETDAIRKAWDREAERVPAIFAEIQRARTKALRIPDEKAIWEYALQDNKGRFWLSAPSIPFVEPDSTRVFHVVSQDGNLLGSANLPEVLDWERAHIVDDTLYAVVERETGLFEPTVFAIRK